MAYLIRGLEFKDIEDVRKWRNSQIGYLRQREMLTPEAQQAWWKKYTDECATYRPKNYLYAMELHEAIDGFSRSSLIAYGGFVLIDWDRYSAETSFLTSPTRLEPSTYVKDYDWFLKQLIELAQTRQWGLKELRSVTFDYWTDKQIQLGQRPNQLHLEVLKANKFRVHSKIEEHQNLRDVYFHVLRFE